MTRLRRVLPIAYAAAAYVLPGEFRRRHGAEMQLDFTDQVSASTTASELAMVVGRAIADLATSALREWRDCDALRMLVLAGLAHTIIWMMAVGVAAWQWPGGSRLFPAVLTFAITSIPGIALTVLRQRFNRPHAMHGSLS